jgi:hypothetical protein
MTESKQPVVCMSIHPLCCLFTEDKQGWSFKHNSTDSGLLIVMALLELLTDHRLRCIRLRGFLLSAKEWLFIFGVFVLSSFIGDKR